MPAVGARPRRRSRSITLAAQARALREGEYLNFKWDRDQPMQGEHRSPWHAEVRTRLA